MRVIRARTAVASLALVAMLLLVAMPTVGRYFGGGFSLPGETAPVESRMPMHDMASMTPAEHAAHMQHMAGSQHAPREAPASPHAGHAAHDCDYCPLLSGLMQASIPPAPFHGPPALAPWTIRAIATPPAEAPVPALGAQGPPSVETG